MNAVDSPESLRYLPAKHAHSAAHAFVPALLLGVWSAMLLLDGELHLAAGSVPWMLLGVISLPVVWFVLWVVVLKALILVSVLIMKALQSPPESYRKIVSGIFVVLCSAFSLWLISRCVGWSADLGYAWFLGFPAYAVWRCVTALSARPH